MHGSCPCCPGNHIFCLEMFEDNASEIWSCKMLASKTTVVKMPMPGLESYVTDLGLYLRLYKI